MNDKLISLRRERGITQEDAARLLGVSRSQVSAWERGTRHLSAIAIAKYQKAFDLDGKFFSDLENAMLVDQLSIFDLSRLNSRGAAALFDFYNSLLKNKEYLKKP